MGLLEHKSGYNLEVSYIKGIKIVISDVLSRMIKNTNTLREDFEMLSEHQCIDSLEQVRLEPELVDDPLICKMATEGNNDSSYKRMLEALNEGV